MNKKEVKDFIICLILLDEHFDDVDKVAFWMTTNNPNLGGMKPFDLFLRARGHRVRQFIERQVKLNE